MSNFTCEHCGANICDSPRGYVTGCEHYPTEEEDCAYNHIPVKPAFTVQVIYTHAGKMKPRQFPPELMKW